MIQQLRYYVVENVQVSKKVSTVVLYKKPRLQTDTGQGRLVKTRLLHVIITVVGSLMKEIAVPRALYRCPLLLFLKVTHTPKRPMGKQNSMYIAIYGQCIRFMYCLCS